MARGSLDAVDARRQLYAVMKSDGDFTEKAERALELGEAYLGVENAHVTKIHPESDYWKAIASTGSEDGKFPTGLVLDLERTYCRRTIGQADPVALHDVPEQGWEDDPAYQAHNLGCYHGVTITIEEETYGTVCFVAEDPRSEPFTDDETMFAELVARMLEHELERERTQAKLDRLDEFAGMVSHDLRNPLGVARLRLETERETNDSEHVDAALSAIERMDRLIGDVLAVARQGRNIDETERVTLSSVAEECWEMVESEDATLTVESDLVFRADRARLRQLLENVFRNSVEHGGDGVEIRVGRLGDDGFYVEDDGPGIPDPDRERVFESGFTTGDEGPGLGLSIVESIVDAHEWAVTVTESDEGGARFEVTDLVVPGDEMD